MRESDDIDELLASVNGQDEGRDRGNRLRMLLTVVLAIAAAVATGAAGWHIFFGGEGGQHDSQGGVPLLKADQRPVKNKPEDRGGMEVPNQDKLVYGRLGNAEGEQPQVEKLLPPPEVPQAPPQAPPPQASPPQAPPPRKLSLQPKPGEPPMASPAPVTAVTTEALPAPGARPPAGMGAMNGISGMNGMSAMSGMAAGKPLAQGALPPVNAAKPAPVAVTGMGGMSGMAGMSGQNGMAGMNGMGSMAGSAPTSLLPPKPQQLAAVPPPQKAAAPAPAPAKAGGGGAYLVQLAALKDQGAAEKEWARFQHANSDLLGSLSSDIAKVELGEKGTYWRLRAGPLEEPVAKTLCSELSQRKIGCMVVKK